MLLVATQSRECPKCESSGRTNHFGGILEYGQVAKWCSLCFGQTIVPEDAADRYLTGLLLYNTRIAYDLPLAVAASICNITEFQYARLEHGYPCGKVTPKIGEQILDMGLKDERNTECEDQQDQ